MLMIIPITSMLQRPASFLAPRKNKWWLTMLRKLLSNKHLTKPYKLFFLGAGKNNKLSGHCLLLLLCVRILLLPTLIALLLPILWVDFSQKIWYNHGIVGGGKARPKIDFIFVGKYLVKKLNNITWLVAPYWCRLYHDRMAHNSYCNTYLRLHMGVHRITKKQIEFL